jgi:2-oxoisovalerate dehydrogenase E1 component
MDKITSTHRPTDVLAAITAAPADFDPATAAEVPAAVQNAVLRTFAEILGLDQGLCGGRGGSMHLADVDGGVMTSAIVGGGIPVAAGQALAARLRGNGGVALASFGDGATSIGAFHEAAVLARSWHLPMIFLLENNQYSVATTLQETAGFEQLPSFERLHMPALIVDGMDRSRSWGR